MVFLTMLIISANSASLENTTCASQIDSCKILKKLVSKKWTYQKKGNYFVDSLNLFYHSHLHPAFINCLINKNKSEIIKLLGKPSNYSSSTNVFNYCMSPNTNPECCYVSLMIKFNNKGTVKSADISGCETIE